MKSVKNNDDNGNANVIMESKRKDRNVNVNMWKWNEVWNVWLWIENNNGCVRKWEMKVKESDTMRGSK